MPLGISKRSRLTVDHSEEPAFKKCRHAFFLSLYILPRVLLHGFVKIEKTPLRSIASVQEFLFVVTDNNILISRTIWSFVRSGPFCDVRQVHSSLALGK